ncbi:MAG: hypothetical protein HS111_10400 [Kofleriaceae bacterium]|nr:hypothetical protein [Kofleriaceae bacterium]
MIETSRSGLRRRIGTCRESCVVEHRATRCDADGGDDGDDRGLQAERAELAAKVAALEESLTGLAHENALLKRRLFGIRTERSQTSELQLALGDLLATEAKLQAELDAAVGRPARRRHRRPGARARRGRTAGATCSPATCRGSRSRSATRSWRPRARG